MTLLTCIVFYSDRDKDYPFTFIGTILFPLIFLIALLIIQFILFFRDINKKFIYEPDAIIFTNKVFIGEPDRIFLTKKNIRLSINRNDIINYRYLQGGWLYANITIYLKDDKKIKISNLNDNFKIINNLLKDWCIETRPFF
jgi:hypothetical protein